MGLDNAGMKSKIVKYVYTSDPPTGAVDKGIYKLVAPYPTTCSDCGRLEVPDKDYWICEWWTCICADREMWMHEDDSRYEG